jgi:hypothetical protein
MSSACLLDLTTEGEDQSNGLTGLPGWVSGIEGMAGAASAG